jgi:hypothetical protein
MRLPRMTTRRWMVAVAVLALLTPAMTRWIPDAWWRYRIDQLVTTKVEGDAPGDDHPGWSQPSFQLYHGLSNDELRIVRRDPGQVVDRLLGSIAAPGVEAHRQKVLHALGIYLDEVAGTEQPRRFIARGTRMLASGSLPIGLETDLASDVALRARSFGMEAGDREAFRERARVVLRKDRPHPDYAKVWAWSLAQLGGCEEKEIVVGAWDRLDRNGRSKVLETGLLDIACQ